MRQTQTREARLATMSSTVRKIDDSLRSQVNMLKDLT